MLRAILPIFTRLIEDYYSNYYYYFVVGTLLLVSSCFLSLRSSCRSHWPTTEHWTYYYSEYFLVSEADSTNMTDCEKPHSVLLFLVVRSVVHTTEEKATRRFMRSVCIVDDDHLKMTKSENVFMFLFKKFSRNLVTPKSDESNWNQRCN